jgi:hypothetical protein
MPDIVNNYGGNEPTQLRYYYGGIDPMVHSMRNVLRRIGLLLTEQPTTTTTTETPSPVETNDIIQHNPPSEPNALARGR